MVPDVTIFQKIETLSEVRDCVACLVILDLVEFYMVV